MGRTKRTMTRYEDALFTDGLVKNNFILLRLLVAFLIRGQGKDEKERLGGGKWKFLRRAKLNYGVEGAVAGQIDDD